MAIFVPYVARYTVSTAGNADLNPTPDAAVNITFSSVDPNILITGDLTLDNNFDTLDPNYPFDPDTWISVNGGPLQQFDILFYGTILPKNAKNYDNFLTGGPNFNTPTLVAIQLADGTELFFYPTESYTLAEMDLFPNGGVDVNYDPASPVLPPVICFVNGTYIKTVHADVPVEDLRVGDVILSRDNGPQTISWIGSRRLSGSVPTHLLPIRIKANALGDGLPERDLLVSPQHRILVTDWRAELLFGAPEVLVAAKHLVNDTDIRAATDMTEFEYYHILFGTHQTIFSEGLPTESLHPGEMAIDSLSADARAEVLELFPELANDAASYGPSTHRSLKAFEVKALRRV